jgi:hypothetical protein
MRSLPVSADYTPDTEHVRSSLDVHLSQYTARANSDRTDQSGNDLV